MIIRRLKSKIIGVRIVSYAVSGITQSGALGTNFCLGSTIRRGTFNTLVPSALTQSKGSRLVCSDRRRRRLSTVGNREKSHTGAEKPLGRGNPWLRPRWSRFAMIISVTAGFVMGATFLRVREDKLSKDCLLEQVVEHAAVQNINAFIDAGLAIAGTNRE